MNLSIESDYSVSHILCTWIQGEEFSITKKIVSEALHVPLVRDPTYPYDPSPPIDDVMSLLCGKPVTWGTEPIIHSLELTEFHYMLFRIVVHNIFPIFHVHTIPIDRCVFVYSLRCGLDLEVSHLCFFSLFSLLRTGLGGQRLLFILLFMNSSCSLLTFQFIYQSCGSAPKNFTFQPLFY